MKHDTGQDDWAQLQVLIAQIQERLGSPSLFVGALFRRDGGVSGGPSWVTPEPLGRPEAKNAKMVVDAAILGSVLAHCDQQLALGIQEYGQEYFDGVQQNREGYRRQWRDQGTDPAPIPEDKP